MITLNPGMYVGGITWDEWEQRVLWCREQWPLGGWAVTDDGEFRFDCEADRLLFLLKWS